MSPLLPVSLLSPRCKGRDLSFGKLESSSRPMMLFVAFYRVRLVLLSGSSEKHLLHCFRFEKYRQTYLKVFEPCYIPILLRTRLPKWQALLLSHSQ